MLPMKLWRRAAVVVIVSWWWLEAAARADGAGGRSVWGAAGKEDRRREQLSGCGTCTVEVRALVRWTGRRRGPGQRLDGMEQESEDKEREHQNSRPNK